MRRFAKRWDAASPAQMLESLSAPERRQVQAEQAQGAVFFCYHPQLKLCGMNLLYARKALPAGQDGKGILCLERLQRFSVSGELAVLWGEFSVPGRPGHIVAGKLRVKGPLQNVRRLQAFLCWKQEQAGGQPPAGCREKLAGCLWRVRAFAAGQPGRAAAHGAGRLLFPRDTGRAEGLCANWRRTLPPLCLLRAGRARVRAGGCWPLAGRSRPACRGGGAAAKKLPARGARAI